MIDAGALAAIRAGRRGVHVVHRQKVYEATGQVGDVGGLTMIGVRHLDGSQAAPIPARETVALARTYEPEPEA